MSTSVYDFEIKDLPERYRLSLSVPSFGELPFLPSVGDVVLYHSHSGVSDLIIQSVFSRHSGLYVKAKNINRFSRSVFVFPLSLLSPVALSDGCFGFSLDDIDFLAWKNFCRQSRSGVNHE